MKHIVFKTIVHFVLKVTFITLCVNNLLVKAANNDHMVINKNTATVEKQCIPAKNCLHGRCDLLTKACECFIGWTGLSCEHHTLDSLETTVRSKLGINEETTMRHNAKLNHNELEFELGTKETETDESNWITKILLGEIIRASIQDPKQDNFLLNEQISPLHDIQPELNACSEDYIRHSLKDRMCRMGLLCQFGTCSKVHHDTYIAFECTCDRGAIGLFCEHKCCLNCGEYGTCSLFPNGTQFCDCQIGYSGESCELTETDIFTKIKDSKPYSNYLPLALIVITASCSIIIILLVTCKVLLKHRNTTVMRLLRHFQNYEDDDSFIYDVLVWYHDDAESRHILADKLLPYLQKHSVSVCTTTGTNYKESKQSLQKTIQTSRRLVLALNTDLVLQFKSCDKSLLQQASTNTNKVIVINLCDGHSGEKVISSLEETVCAFNVYLQHPNSRNNNEVSSFYRKFSVLLPKKRNIPTKDTPTTIDNAIV